MPSELDRRYDEMLAELTGPGAPLVIERDTRGRPIVGNFPSTLPGLFRAFCELHAANEAVVAGDERLSFADLDRISDRLARGLAARGIAKGDRVAIAMRNCPSWVVSYMAIVKAGAIATLINGWWEAHEMEHALGLAQPKLVLADIARAFRISRLCEGCDVVTLLIERPVEEAIAELVNDDDTLPPELQAGDDATLLFTSGSTGNCKGALSTHRAVTTGTYAYSSAQGIRRPRPGRCSMCRCSTLPAKSR